LWFLKTLDTFDFFEIGDLEKLTNLGERWWCNNVTGAGHFEWDGIVQITA
jgi:hypothetical protein